MTMRRKPPQDTGVDLVQSGISAELLRTETGRPRLTPESQQVMRTLSRLSARSGRLSPLGYNLAINHEHRFVWYRVAKVATRTVLSYLEEHQVPLDVRTRRMRYPTVLFEDYTKFAFVRNPMDRFVSAWKDKVVAANYFGFDSEAHARMQSVEAFAAWTAAHDLSDLAEADQHLALQSRLVDLTQVDHLGRLETFDEDFARIMAAIGLPGTPLARLNASNRSSGGAAPSDELRAIVGGIYRRDFEILGYPPPAPA